MTKTILTTNEFLNMPKAKENPLTETEFLKKFWTTDCNDCNGWKFKGQFTTDIEEAKEWFNNLNKNQ